MQRIYLNMLSTKTWKVKILYSVVDMLMLCCIDLTDTLQLRSLSRVNIRVML